MVFERSKLEQLPPEVFTHIISHVEQAQTIATLSRVSKPLHLLTQVNGWHAFVSTTFPSFTLRDVTQNDSTPGNVAKQQNRPVPRRHDLWQEIARSLLTASKNWDLRALQASFVQPAGDIVQLQTDNAVNGEEKDSERPLLNLPAQRRLFRPSPEHSPARSDSSTQSESRQARVTPKQIPKWRLPRGQTMGFTPAIDTYEAIEDSKWTDRKEVLAYSAGSELILRTRQQPNNRKADGSFYSQRWATYRPPGAREGIDDITFVKLFRNQGTTRNRHEEGLLLGTAAGSLQHIAVRISHSRKPFNIVRQVYNTSGRPVQAACISQNSPSTDNPILAAILGDLSLCIYSTDLSEKPLNGPEIDNPPAVVQPLSERRLANDGIRAWRTSFLNPRTLAVSLGPSSDPIQLYAITPSGLSQDPIARFATFDRHNTEGRISPKIIYPIEPLWDGDGRVFASGGFDGYVRVHDTRSPTNAQYLLDSMEDGPIYSLLARPNARIIAGAARHNVCKVFDLRNKRAILQPRGPDDSEAASNDQSLTLSNQQDPIPEPLEEPIPWKQSNMRCIPGLSTSRASLSSHDSFHDGSYNLYIPRQATRNDGPVYSLSSPSPFSPFIYMGLENSVVELQVDSLCDPHRDPVLGMTTRGRYEDEQRDAKRQGRKPRNVAKDVLLLKSAGMKGELLEQGPLFVGDWRGQAVFAGDEEGRWDTGKGQGWDTFPGLDKRWVSAGRNR
ncbi:hypothetical protein C1H76_7377 [Elsinoe australis]|uniref:F-box domain-containing protein n=1 Tax=Elsinoe australis TaxID=40998 RepID=A0A4U7AVS5_9PEZI|nr:hypothetical protein C1H76_7377 [Elsinoe australis]